MITRVVASATSWQRVPFSAGDSILYVRVFDTEQFGCLKIGLIPQQMEDKWFIYYEEPHLYFHRSWTGQPVYRLALRTTQNGAEVCQAL